MKSAGIFCLVFSFFVFSVVSFGQLPAGIGMVKPRIVAGTSLYLYSGQLIDDLLQQSIIKDSLTFVQGQYNVEIGNAPPWFVPELIKLDYDLLYLRAVTIARNWIEVLVNTKTGRTAWLDRQVVDYTGWPEFFLNVYSVELLTAIKNPLRIKPLNNASIITDPGRNNLKPVAVMGEWMKVATMHEEPGAIPKLGWIRWKEGNQLLITWSSLS